MVAKPYGNFTIVFNILNFIMDFQGNFTVFPYSLKNRGVAKKRASELLLEVTLKTESIKEKLKSGPNYTE